MLRRVYIELNLCRIVDFLFDFFKSLNHFAPEFFEPFRVNTDTPLFHPGQHRNERHFYFSKDIGKFLLGKMPYKNRVQCLRSIFCFKLFFVKAFCNVGNLEFSLVWVQHPGSHLNVKNGLLYRLVFLVKPFQDFFPAVSNFRFWAFEQTRIFCRVFCVINKHGFRNRNLAVFKKVALLLFRFQTFNNTFKPQFSEVWNKTVWVWFVVY